MESDQETVAEDHDRWRQNKLSDSQEMREEEEKKQNLAHLTDREIDVTIKVMRMTLTTTSVIIMFITFLGLHDTC